MKASLIIPFALGLFITVSCLVLPPRPALAQESSDSEAAEKYSREELAQMLAPIALYPDTLLTQILMASTYPIEVVEADRWVRKNPGLKGESLDAALLNREWSPSVKAICHFPSILALMSERITDTTNLGNAFLAQEAEVLDMVQELRAKARARGNLTTTSKQKVIVEKETIIIQPADPMVIFVPYYDPLHVYGPWWYPAFPPYFWGPPGVSIRVGISYWPGVYFGFVFGSWCSFDWHHHSIYIDVHKRPRFVSRDRWITHPGRWQHDPIHRRGVAYLDKPTARKFGQTFYRSGDLRRDTRGFPGQPDQERRGDDRTRIGPATPVDEQRTIDRAGQERQRLELESQERERVERSRREEQRAAQEKESRDRAQRLQQERAKVQRDKEERQRTEQQRQVGEQAEGDRQARQPIGRERRPREQRPREQVEGGKAGQRQRAEVPGRDNIFDRVDNGSTERQSSERGRVSRQGRDNDSRGSGRPDSEEQGGRDRR